MKKIFIPILLLVCLSGCEEDLTSYYDRLLLRENANDSLKNENAKVERENDAQAKWNAALEEMNARVALESEELARKLDSLEQTLVVPVEPKLLTIEFIMDENPILPENVPCKIIGDSLIECWIPLLTPEKYLIPRFTFDGTLVTINGMEAISGVSMFDFRKPAKSFSVVKTSEKNSVPSLMLTIADYFKRVLS